MPMLQNTRYERFAQGLAAGKKPEDAYVEAGYKPARQNAHRMMTRDDIRMRVAELQERAAIRAEITVASITADLMRIAQKGEAMREAAGLAVARAALMDAAKLNGLVVDKAEHVNINHVVSAELPTADEWAAAHVTEH